MKKILEILILIKMRGFRLLAVFVKERKIPLKWRISFIKSLFWPKIYFCKEFQRILQSLKKKNNHYDFNNLKVLFYPLKSSPNMDSAEYFVECFLTIIFPALYGGYIYHPLSYIESNYFDDKKLKIKPSDIIFDCGAFIGHFTIGAAKKTYKGKVFAFEPFQENMKLLLKNIKLNNFKNVVLIQKAVSENEKEITFCFQKGVPSGSGIYTESRARIGESRSIQCTTIDQIFKEYALNRVDFIKMDIEGMERKALMGAKEVISKFKPKLSICTYHLPDDPIILPKIIKKIRSDYTIEMKIGKLYAY